MRSGPGATAPKATAQGPDGPPIEPGKDHAEPLAILEPSPAPVTPLCRHFGVCCGSCALQAQSGFAASCIESLGGEVFLPGRTRPASCAKRTWQLATHMDEPTRAGSLMQRVNVLGQSARLMLRFELRKRDIAAWGRAYLCQQRRRR